MSLNLAHQPANNSYSASLFVGNIDQSVTEAQLFEKFSPYGLVASIRICRDKISKTSLGYAYVNFFEKVSAEHALDNLNFEKLVNKNMHIMWSQRDPSLRKSGANNVFIKNLDKQIDAKSLYDTFSAFGNILSCKIMTDENLMSLGYGFVHFETAEAANNAIKGVNNMLLNEKKVYVAKFIPNCQRKKENDTFSKGFNNVYVKNFDETCDDKKLREIFEKFGEITSAVVAKNDYGKSIGYGFVNFKEASDAESAVKFLHESDFNSKKLYVARFQSKQERLSNLKKLHQEKLNRSCGMNIYIKNLEYSIDDEVLKKEFSRFGTITSAKVIKEGERSKGFGFVCFSSNEEAKNAIIAMNGRVLCNKSIYVGLAQRKEERKKMLTKRFMQKLNSPNHFYTEAASFLFPSLQHFPNQTDKQVPVTNNFKIANNDSSYLSNQYLNSRPTQINPSTLNYFGINIAGNALSSPQIEQQMLIKPQKPKMISQKPITPADYLISNMQKTNSKENHQQTSSASKKIDQKEVIAECIYPLVQRIRPQLTDKLISKLLDADNTEILKKLSPNELISKINQLPK